jgi:glycogen debranching enzyme
VLSDLAKNYDPGLAQICDDNRRTSEEAILQHMYDRETHTFHHLWRAKDGTQQKYTVKTIQTLFPLLLTSLPDEALQEIVKLLRDDNQFGTKYMVPTVSKSEREYNPIANTDLLWRGPIWGFTNWFVMEGLEKHGHRYSGSVSQTNCSDDVMTIMNKWIEMVQQNGIWEHYNPDTGKGYGAEGLGMSCLIVDWMARLNLVQVPKS